MKRFFIIIVLIAGVHQLSAQMILQDPVTAKVFNATKYSGVEGSPFLFDEWMKGNVMTPKGTYYNLQIKFNAYDNLLFFNKDDQAYEFADDVVGFVIMPPDKDSTKYLFFKNNVIAEGVSPQKYLQVLSNGNLLLYKLFSKAVSDVNQVNQGIIKTFTTSNKYYAGKINQVHQIYLTKKNILDLLGDKEQEINRFIKERNLNLKKEEDVQVLFNYYNSLSP